MKTKIFAHYLPQFHRIKENSEWWGEGFTEWTNVAKARAVFPNHFQPHVPRDLGFYDLAHVEIMREQATLAKQHGIDGFNFYFYRFGGRRLLQKPLENFLNSDIDFEFSLCWANENWTRRWDGANSDILMGQTYEENFEIELFKDLLPFLTDSRYLRVDGKPVFSIYRAQEIPNVVGVMASLREVAVASGLPGLHIVAVESFGLESPSLVGADALMEFPPHGAATESQAPVPDGCDANFAGEFYDIRKTAKWASRKKAPDFTYYRGLMPGWDNTARVGLRAKIFLNSSPALFALWLDYALAWSQKYFSAEKQSLIFINAWNEWAEGAHLEPDLKYSSSFLEVVKQCTRGEPSVLELAKLALDQVQILPESQKIQAPPAKHHA